MNDISIKSGNRPKPVDFTPLTMNAQSVSNLLANHIPGTQITLKFSRPHTQSQAQLISGHETKKNAVSMKQQTR